jgi:hypothetical protein
MERFRRTMDRMEFETLPLFSKPLVSWNLHTDYVGRRFIYRPSTESTMDDARSMLQRWRFQDGAVMLAESQTAGRRRAGRYWVSPPDVNLYFTVILRTAGRDPRSLSYVTPLAIAEAIEATAEAHGASLHVDLKWPNGRADRRPRVAGVIMETASTPEDEPVARSVSASTSTSTRRPTLRSPTSPRASRKRWASRCTASAARPLLRQPGAPVRRGCVWQPPAV